MYKRSIIFGNGINYNKKPEITLDKYIEIRIKKHFNTLWGIRGLSENIPLNLFIGGIQDLYELVWECKKEDNVDPFDGLIKLIYDVYFECEEELFPGLDLKYAKPHYRLEDLINSIVIEWLVGAFEIYDQSNVSSETLKILNSFDGKMTLNYVAPEGMVVSFVHGNLDLKNPRKVRDINKLNSIPDEAARAFHIFFQNLPYFDRDVHFGISEAKNGDNLEALFEDEEFKNEMIELKKDYELLVKEIGSKETVRLWTKGDHPSYNENLLESELIVVFAISVKNDEHLVHKLIEKCKRLVYIWFTEEDLKSFNNLKIESKNVSTMHYSDFIKNYEKL